jgi:3alpha(or 20beta)-hydroxysteroid dehydrogenase
MGRLTGRVAIITGAARGQGEAEARLFADEGAQVLLADVLDDEGTAVASSIGDAATYVHLDVTSAADWDAALATCVERFGPPTILVNNAGILTVGTMLETDEATFRRTLDVNLVGAFLGMKAVAPVMADAGGGSIVNISSVAGLTGRSGFAAYASSKWGLRGLSKTAAVELGHSGIRVNSIHPGAIETIMVTGGTANVTVEERNEMLGGQPIPRIGQPEEVARLALFLASEESSYSTGGEFVIDGGRLAGS